MQIPDNKAREIIRFLDLTGSTGRGYADYLRGQLNATKPRKKVLQ